jgi:hypothetical protein
MMRYMVVVEEGPSSFGVYVPDLPGGVAVGESKQEALKLIREAVEREAVKREAVEFHLHASYKQARQTVKALLKF